MALLKPCSGANPIQCVQWRSQDFSEGEANDDTILGGSGGKRKRTFCYREMLTNNYATIKAVMKSIL